MDDQAQPAESCEGCVHRKMGVAPECRRYPPVIPVIPQQNAMRQVALAPVAMFPPAAMRCGEYKDSGKEVFTAQ